MAAEDRVGAVVSAANAIVGSRENIMQMARILDKTFLLM